jgi:hypothetical protein
MDGRAAQLYLTYLGFHPGARLMGRRNAQPVSARRLSDATRAREDKYNRFAHGGTIVCSAAKFEIPDTSGLNFVTRRQLRN